MPGKGKKRTIHSTPGMLLERELENQLEIQGRPLKTQVGASAACWRITFLYPSRAPSRAWATPFTSFVLLQANEGIFESSRHVGFLGRPFMGQKVRLIATFRAANAGGQHPTRGRRPAAAADRRSASG